MALPALTSEQRKEALKKAADSRRARSELLDQVKKGATTVRDVLQRADTDEVVRKTKLTQLLKAVPGYGPAKVDELLEQAHITSNRKVGGLGQRQRQALLNALS